MGIDVGATLAKVAVRDGAGTRFEHLPSSGLDRVARLVERTGPRRLGLTGGGAFALSSRLSLDTARVGEFEAWAAGTRALRAPGQADRYLLVSLGTGTSIMLADAGRVVRVGGTPLGGGTLLGLGRQMLGTADFEAIVALAARGQRRRVDLSVADVYPGDAEAPLAADLTASSFARLARMAEPARPEDLAQALVGMVGENIALVAGGIALVSGVEEMVFGGSTLRGNETLRGVIRDIAARFGRRATFLDHGEFGAALGALLVADGAGSPD